MQVDLKTLKLYGWPVDMCGKASVNHFDDATFTHMESSGVCHSGNNHHSHSRTGMELNPCIHSTYSYKVLISGRSPCTAQWQDNSMIWWRSTPWYAGSLRHARMYYWIM